MQLEFADICLESGLKLKNIDFDELSSLYQLPRVPNHQDPFDRMLIWQCIKNNYSLISRDKKIEVYKDYGLKIIN